MKYSNINLQSDLLKNITLKNDDFKISKIEAKTKYGKIYCFCRAELQFNKAKGRENEFYLSKKIGEFHKEGCEFNGKKILEKNPMDFLLKLGNEKISVKYDENSNKKQQTTRSSTSSKQNKNNAAFSLLKKYINDPSLHDELDDLFKSNNQLISLDNKLVITESHSKNNYKKHYLLKLDQKREVFPGRRNYLPGYCKYENNNYYSSESLYFDSIRFDPESPIPKIECFYCIIELANIKDNRPKGMRIFYVKLIKEIIWRDEQNKK